MTFSAKFGSEPSMVIIEREKELLELLRLFSSYRLAISGTSAPDQAFELFQAVGPTLLLVNPEVSGFPLLDRLRLGRGASRIVVLTGSDAIADRCRRMGIERVLVVDSGPSAVVEEVAALLQLEGSDYEPDNYKVLLADADSGVRDMHSELLSLNGFSVVAAGSGPEALERIEQDSEIVVAVLDLLLPDMGGLETLSRIASMKEPPGVIVTGSLVDRVIASEARKLGAFDYLLKPVDPESLEASIVACVAEAEYRSRSWLDRLLFLGRSS